MAYLKYLPLLLLVACTPNANAVVDAVANQGVENVKSAEDTKAAIAVQVPCAMSVGAFNRALSADQQRAVMALCGGNTERPVTVEDLQRFLAQ